MCEGGTQTKMKTQDVYLPAPPAPQKTSLGITVNVPSPDPVWNPRPGLPGCKEPAPEAAALAQGATPSAPVASCGIHGQCLPARVLLFYELRLVSSLLCTRHLFEKSSLGII